MFMDNSENIPKISKKTIESIAKGMTIDHKWSNVKVPCLTSKSTKKNKAYVTNHFLNNYFLEKSEKELISYRNIANPDNLYKYRLVYKDQDAQKYASFSSLHSALASVVLDLPPVDNENPVVTSLRNNVYEIKEGLKDRSTTSIDISKYTGEKSRYYKGMIKHIIVSDNELASLLNCSSIKENSNGTYTIDKK